MIEDNIVNLFVVVSSGSSLGMLVDLDSTVQSVEAMVVTRLGIATGSFYLAYAGKVLGVNHALKDYGVSKEAPLFLYNRVLGGVGEGLESGDVVEGAPAWGQIRAAGQGGGGSTLLPPQQPQGPQGVHQQQTVYPTPY